MVIDSDMAMVVGFTSTFAISGHDYKGVVNPT